MVYGVIDDHFRTLTITITDDTIPDGDGRCYMLGRVLWRVVWYSREFINAQSGFLSSLVDSVVNLMGGIFPELLDRRNDVVEMIVTEEQTFLRTLDRGTEWFKHIAKKLKAKQSTVVSGADDFFLYDTMGFHLDHTKRMAEEVGLTIDESLYKIEMETARERSRAERVSISKHNGSVRLEFEAEETA